MKKEKPMDLQQHTGMLPCRIHLNLATFSNDLTATAALKIISSQQYSSRLWETP
jgi:hypothetical protein